MAEDTGLTTLMGTTACRPKSRDSKAGAEVPEPPSGRLPLELARDPPWESLGRPPSPTEATASLGGSGGRGEHLQTLVPAQDTGDAGTRRPWRKRRLREAGGGLPTRPPDRSPAHRWVWADTWLVTPLALKSSLQPHGCVTAKPGF